MAFFSLSVFFPCYNDEHTIKELVRTADRILKRKHIRYELIVVDDGSTDQSRKILNNLKTSIPTLRIISHMTNKGYGGALQSGFRAARNDVVFYTDGDGQYDVREMELLLPLLTDDIDVVNGIKISRQDPWYRIIVGNLYNFFTRNAFGIEVFDTDCDFRLIRRSLLRKLKLSCTSGAICVELVKKLQLAGARFREVSVHHYDRKFGASQFFKPRHLFHSVAELLFLWISFYILRDD